MFQVDNNISTWGRIKDSDIYHSFIKSPTAIISSIILLIIFFCSFFVEFITPYNPFDPSSLSLMDAFTPPSWTEDGIAKFILGTDGQGRDMLATILYGSRISLIVGFSAILFSLLLGVGLGLTAGYFGGKYEMIVMRLTDVQLTVPSILMALLVDGIARGLITREMHDEMAIYVLIFAIGISEWPQFARVSRAATLVEKNKDANDVDTVKLEKVLEQKISEKNVIVGHLAPYVLDKNKIKIMIVLRRDPYDLISTYKERKYTDKKNRENAGSEVLGIIAYDAISEFQEKVFQINTSGRSIQEMVGKIITIISSNKGNEDVDWLNLVIKNNDLKKFFAD